MPRKIDMGIRYNIEFIDHSFSLWALSITRIDDEDIKMAAINGVKPPARAIGTVKIL